MLNYIEAFIGTILALVAAIILGYFLGSLGSYLGFFAVSIIIGYSNGKDITNGAIYGIIVSVSAGLIFTIFMILMWAFALGGMGDSMLEFGLFGIIIGLAIDTIIGAVGGTIGTLINH